ncbi:MAG: cobalamin biosynthesis protein CbiD [Lachnospiraceae bacterium]|nr:cobalamin biosynthesis protein CbiD [Lachnospiraceae bacterium]
MLDTYIFHGKEKLRCGYTTGSCAAAAAKASALMLLGNCRIDEVSISTPKGIDLNLLVVDVSGNFSDGERFVKCGIVKDGGDDADVTDGITVYAKVSLCEQGIQILGGEGVGIVTKKGLDQPVGNHAINSTPRRMITKHLLEVMEEQEYGGGLKVEISIPAGVELAKKTFNPRLGIEGGISVIGTTGIVEPMSNAAIVETIRIEERMLRETGRKNVLITLGNYGKSFLKNEMPDVLERCVTCSNFIGEAIDFALEFGFEGVLMVGHIGKMVKLGAGIMNTHSANADGRMDVLISCGVRAGIESNKLIEIADCVTVDDALEVLMEHPLYDKMIEILMERIDFYLNNKVKNEIPIAAIIFSNRYGIIGKTKKADELKNVILSESRK